MPKTVNIAIDGPAGAGKSTMAKRLAKELGCERLICAGDAPNDAQMLKMADFAFCPSDASPEILALPNIIATVPAAEGAITQAITHLDNLF